MTEIFYHSSGDNSPTRYSLDFSNFNLNLHMQNGEIFLRKKPPKIQKPKPNKTQTNKQNQNKTNLKKPHQNTKPNPQNNSSRDFYHQFKTVSQHVKL